MPASLFKRFLTAAELLLLGATLAGCVLLHRPGEWEPLTLSALLIALSACSDWFSVRLSEGALSASTVVIVLAMGLLGPAPAAACGLTTAVSSSVARRVPLRQILNNLAVFTAIPFAGGLAVRSANDWLGLTHGSHGIALGLVLLAVFVATLIANFVLAGLVTFVEQGQSLGRQLPEFLPFLPGELAAGMLATILAVAFRYAGMSVLIAAIVVLLIFQYLTVALLRSEERAEHLKARSRQLVGLQLGVLRTLVRALEMRDSRSARHAATVAAYATALGKELGCDEDEIDVLRAAGLLHEIGKFTWPDRVLHAQTVADEDRGIIESHPQVGSVLVGALDGYGPVADAILYHRERMDGRGYPAQLIGSEIPLASRILAVCSTYDTLCGDTSYRAALPPDETREELRIAARNGQLDPELVDVFLRILETRGEQSEAEPDFEVELEFERRVRDMAEPDAEVAPPSAIRAGREWLGRLQARSRQ